MPGSRSAYSAEDIDRRLQGLPRQDLLDVMRRRVLEHGDATKWQQALGGLPTVTPVETDFTAGVAARGEIRPATFQQLEVALQGLHPWRKGPFELYGMRLDTEWRSDWKWTRIAALQPHLADARVLDVGCGNGYYGWRMLAAGAREIVGVDPTALFYYQHLAICHALGHEHSAAVSNQVLPLKLEELTPQTPFDTVFSMGVLYHRREPRSHLQELAAHLRAGGTLVLETLVATTDLYPASEPAKRYARMRNVHVVPSVDTVLSWLDECGFINARSSAVVTTTTSEQRSTPWMRFESLAESLDPSDPGRTVEGYPAPARACFVAELPR